MKVNVWDTYVKKQGGGIMHFDILAPAEVMETKTIFEFGKQYLISKDQGNSELTSNQCRFCHVEQLQPEWEENIRNHGYHIIEMEGC
ncbi:MAG: DUF2024 family protein [bacterium]|nr:DUF2024 family protein [bacterium]